MTEPVAILLTAQRARTIAKVHPNHGHTVPDCFYCKGVGDDLVALAEEVERLRSCLDGETTTCEFCGKPAPMDQYHPYWHNDGAPMTSCDPCLTEEPTTDG